MKALWFRQGPEDLPNCNIDEIAMPAVLIVFFAAGLPPV